MLTCSFVADGDTVEMDLLLDGSRLEEVLSHARTLKLSFPDVMQRARQELAAAFLAVANDGYRDPGDAPMTSREFLRRSRKAAVHVTVNSEGHVTFTFGDDDMLWGHWMTVSRKPDGGWDVSMSE